MVRNILIPLDGSALAERALTYAAWLAKIVGGKLWLFHAMPEPALVNPWSELDAAVRLESLAERLRERGLVAIARTVHDEPTTAILSVAADTQADLIVMSTHGRGGVGRWLYGSVADSVLSAADMPVLMVSAHCEHPWDEQRPLRVMVPLDGSDLSEAALEPAQALVAATGGSMLLARVVEKADAGPFSFDPVGMSIGMASEQQVTAAQKYLDRLNLGAAPGATRPDTLVEVGDPSSTIARLAGAERADLIVMATHGRTGLARLTMGSVATSTLQRARVPVLLTRPSRLPRAAADAATDKTTLGAGAH